MVLVDANERMNLKRMPLSDLQASRGPCAWLSLLGCLLVLAPYRLQAQNLVPNPSFEEVDTCSYWPELRYWEMDQFGGIVPMGHQNTSIAVHSK